MSYALVQLNGTTPGAALALDPTGPPVTIGRDPSRDFPVDDHRCSRLHARIWFEGQVWHIEDCGSRNGTFVNSQRIDRATLQPGDSIRIGERLAVFVHEAAGGDERAWKPSRLGKTTFVERLPALEQEKAVVGQLYTDADSGAIRNAAVLCRVAAEIHKLDNVGTLVDLVISALTAGTQADAVTIWLVGTDGRLKRAAGTASADAGQDRPPVLANLALENNEALLVQQPVLDTSETATGESHMGLGTAICVPIPHRSSRRGAIECHRGPRHDPFNRANLELVIAVAHQTGLALENLEYRERLEQANQQLRKTVSGTQRLIGESPAMKVLHEKTARVAATHSTVLISGESGTGKELVARMIHESSPRSAGPYVAVNCAAFSETLLESELFGHDKGAFTGADRRRLGQFERAHRGTIFLDEIAEMSQNCQAKLLRILEGHPFERVGGSEAIQVDVRIIAATHHKLSHLTKQGRFREDLFFRLRVIELWVPPLRDRGEDVLKLAAHFLDQFRRETGRGPKRLSEAAAQALLDYNWPGNVRELKNAIERSVVLGTGEEVSTFDLGFPDSGSSAFIEVDTASLADAERRHIQRVLNQAGGNKTQACKILGIGRGTLYKRLEEIEKVRKKSGKQ